MLANCPPQYVPASLNNSIVSSEPPHVCNKCHFRYKSQLFHHLHHDTAALLSIRNGRSEILGQMSAHLAGRLRGWPWFTASGRENVSTAKWDIPTKRLTNAFYNQSPRLQPTGFELSGLTRQKIAFVALAHAVATRFWVAVLPERRLEPIRSVHHKHGGDLLHL